MNYLDLIPLILASEISGVPNWIRLFPWGLVKSTKGDFYVTAESADLIMRSFRERGNDVVVDYEHQTLENVQAPASGWIKEYEAREDGFWARVDWTPKAKQYIENKEYRYFSPVVYTRKGDNVLVAIKNVALTNDPAMANVMPIVMKNLIVLKEETQMDFLKKLAEILGIESADEAKVLAALKVLKDAAAVNKLKDINLELGIKETADAAEALTSLKALKTKQTDPAPAHPEVLSLLDLKEGSTLAEIKGKVIALKNPDGFVKTEEFIALKNKLDQRDRDELVTMALTQGKITPAQKQWAEAYALKDAEGFKAFVEQAPVVVKVDQLNLKNPPGGDQITETDALVCKQLGIDTEFLQKNSK